MAIEWDKILDKPDKSYKVQGHQLLELKQKAESNEKKLSELKNTFDDLTKEMASLKTTVSNLESKLKEKDNKIISLEENIENLNNSISTDEEEINRLNKANKEKDDQIASLGSNISRLETELSTVVQEVPKKESEITRLKGRLEDLQATIITKQTIIEEKEDQINQLTMDSEELNKQIVEANAHIEELKEKIPKKPVYEEAEETVKGKSSCPKCGWPTLEEYRTVDGKKQLIRKYCPNTFCLWTSAEEPKIAISLTAEEPKEETQVLSLFKIKGIELEDTQILDSSAVIIIADPVQNTVWIWKGKDSSRFEYAEATRHATKVKNDIVKKTSARIERVNEGDEPENFPKL
jgi:DNA repair exonuclease SbcCD ATPase subunit